MKIFDTFLFLNELDLLEIRLNILDSYVDYFIINESPKTFSGKSKPLYYEDNNSEMAVNEMILSYSYAIQANCMSIQGVVKCYWNDFLGCRSHK